MADFSSVVASWPDVDQFVGWTLDKVERIHAVCLHTPGTLLNIYIYIWFQKVDLHHDPLHKISKIPPFIDFDI